MQEEEELDADAPEEMELEVEPLPPAPKKNLIKLNLSGLSNDIPYEEPAYISPSPKPEPTYIPNILEEPYVEEEHVEGETYETLEIDEYIRAVLQPIVTPEQRISIRANLTETIVRLNA